MSGSEDYPGQAGNNARDFVTTHWSVVLLAGQNHSPQADLALERLCRAYWYPLYAFVRRQGYPPEEAKDLTQEFFSRLLEKNLVGAADPNKGRFRSYLLILLKHFLANEWKKTQRQKRGGGQVLLSLDDEMAEGRYRFEPVDDLTPEKIFERRWAEAVLAQVNTRLRHEYETAGHSQRFEALKVFLLGDGEAVSYAEVAAKLTLSEGAVKSAIHRLRQRYAELFRAEIAHTVTSPDQIDDEVRHLFAALSS